MSLITSSTEIKKRQYEAPVNIERYHDVYRWKTAIATNESEYKNISCFFPKGTQKGTNSLIVTKPSFDFLEQFFYDDGPSGNYYYLACFNMEDFGLLGTKVSTDMCSDQYGNFFVDKGAALDCALYDNPLERCEPLFIERVSNGTFHLNDGYALLAELQKRGYDGDVWGVVSDYTK